MLSTKSEQHVITRRDLGILAVEVDEVDEAVEPLEHVPAEWANNLVDVQTGEVAEGFVPVSAR